MYRTIPIRAKFNDWENDYWADQCRNASSLINCAIYYIKQHHYAALAEIDNAHSLYWRGDELRSGWKTYSCNVKYPELDKVLKTLLAKHCLTINIVVSGTIILPQRQAYASN